MTGKIPPPVWRFDGCRHQYQWTRRTYECWRPNPEDNHMCNILPGSPLRNFHGQLYGMVMNRVSCETHIQDVAIEVKRFTVDVEDVIKLLTEPYNQRVQLLEESKKHKNQLLFNGSGNNIFYDEDLDPSILIKVRKILLDPSQSHPEGQSDAPSLRLSSAVAILFISTFF